jgi:hypothetical protein
MISDILREAAAEITGYRQDYPFYEHDPRLRRWLDAITAEMTALAEALGEPPPRDERTITGECSGCHQITTIRLDWLSCAECTARAEEMMAFLADAAESPEGQIKMAEAEAELRTADAGWLDSLIEQGVGTLRRLSRADRDRVLDGISRGLLEAR